MPGAVGVYQHVLGRQLLGGAETDRLGQGLGLAVGGAYRRATDVGTYIARNPAPGRAEEVTAPAVDWLATTVTVPRATATACLWDMAILPPSQVGKKTA
ncbi:hypothetical protein [Kitasatospora indigofera]|uniref:hypothetical protein n=1 Tax=Kitasatospora indigofera TaxID=67307 RepID=UPI003697577E